MWQTLWEPQFQGPKVTGSESSKNFRSRERKGRAISLQGVKVLGSEMAWPTQTLAWPTQTKFCPTYTTPVGLPKICWPTQTKIPRTAAGCYRLLSDMKKCCVVQSKLVFNAEVNTPCLPECLQRDKLGFLTSSMFSVAVRAGCSEWKIYSIRTLGIGRMPS